MEEQNEWIKNVLLDIFGSGMADALTADAYATYCMVVGLDEAVQFVESTPDIEGCLVYDDNGEFKTWTSSGMTLSEL